jgi:hypothetical protein
MPFILFGFVALGLGAIIRWFLTRKWTWLVCDVNAIAFPKCCPHCLSPDCDSLVDLKSSSRVTANWVIARRLEWWNLRVPHCTDCDARMTNRNIGGLLLGTACFAAAAIFFEPKSLGAIAICALYGYPAWVLAAVSAQALEVGYADERSINIGIKRSTYSSVFLALNKSSRHGRMFSLHL